MTKAKRLQKVAKKYCIDSQYRLRVNVKYGLYDKLDDEAFLTKIFPKRVGYPLMLNDPQTFNEKLQWLKLHDRNPAYTTMVDKYSAKEYIGNRVGQEYIIPTYGVWDHFDDIDFDSLPNQFVLKCTHDSGGIAICTDKATFDFNKAKSLLERSLKHDFYLVGREWPYKNVPRRIIAEQYIEDLSHGDLLDYKMYCFSGHMKLTLVCADRFSETGIMMSHIDRDWNQMPIKWEHYDNIPVVPEKPVNYDKMIELAEQLSQGFPFLRVDFYEIKGKLYIGELTLYPASGFENFDPPSVDYELGAWINLENIYRS